MVLRVLNKLVSVCILSEVTGIIRYDVRVYICRCASCQCFTGIILEYDIMALGLGVGVGLGKNALEQKNQGFSRVRPSQGWLPASYDMMLGFIDVGVRLASVH